MEKAGKTPEPSGEGLKIMESSREVFPDDCRISLLEKLYSGPLHSVWLAQRGDAQVIAKKKAPEYMLREKKKPIHQILQKKTTPKFQAGEDVIWRDGYGVFYDSSLFFSTPQALGIGMIPTDLAFAALDEKLPDKILQWQTGVMHDSQAVFPDNVECCRLEDDQWYLIYPVLKAQDLRSVMRGPRNKNAVPAILAQVTAMLRVLSGSLGYHQDIKPEHILVMEDGNVRLLDPGWRKQRENIDKPGYPDWFQTTPGYYPLLRYSLDDRQALGIIIYEWLTGKLPFEGTIWDNFPKSFDDRSFLKKGPFSEEELFNSRQDFIKSAPRREDRIPGKWWNLIQDLLNFRIDLKETTERLEDIPLN